MGRHVVVASSPYSQLLLTVQNGMQPLMSEVMAGDYTHNLGKGWGGTGRELEWREEKTPVITEASESLKILSYSGAIGA